MTENPELTPSEQLLLHGEEFATKGLVGNVRLPQGGKVAADKIGELLLANVFLTIEQAGGIELLVEEQKRLFGLMKSDTLFVKRATGKTAWPVPSAESLIHGLARSEPVPVADILYDWLAESHGMPWNLAVTKIEECLVQRGLLLEEAHKLLGKTMSRSYRMDPGTLAALPPADLATTRQRLEDCRTQRPDLWKLLLKGIHQGINRRRAEDGGDYDGDD
ncbi:MAG: hypothetical protein ABW153_17380 [Sedimenticola sp.]